MRVVNQWESMPVSRCSCGVYEMVMGFDRPDPGCAFHGERGTMAWSTCERCARTWRHVVGHECPDGGVTP